MTTIGKGTRRKTKKRGIYWRARSGERRAYGDFRAYGGTQEALCPPGETRGTTDPDVATKLYAERLSYWEKRRTAKLRGEVLEGVSEAVTLAHYAEHHLRAKAARGKVSDAHLDADERHLRRADVFWPGRTLGSITPGHVRDWLAWLRVLPLTRKHQAGTRTMSEPNVRHHLNSLSNLFRRAVAEGKTVLNPAAALMTEDRPSGAPVHRTAWLEAHELALLFEAARRSRPKRADIGATFAYPLIATLALTGARPDEVLSLAVADVDFEHDLVHIRPNGYQRGKTRLKTEGSERTVPLWPQLAAILRDYLNARTAREVLAGVPASPLLFPSPATGGKLRDARKLVDRVATVAGWGRGTIRPRMFRHSYASARLQTLDRGEPVALWSVSKELGHGSEAMLKKHYGRLGTVRHRAEVVEFRVEQHRDARLKDGYTVQETMERLFGVGDATLDVALKPLQRVSA